ncbi:MAG: VOC family protein [Hydrogenophaga sp.]|nr:VOC family protein [Hydrogenophaga sp.]
MTSSIRTCLWFRDGRGREAAEFYCSLISGSRVESAFSGDAGHGTFSVIEAAVRDAVSRLQRLAARWPEKP